MSCNHCAQAHEAQHHGYSTTCKGCRLRNIARHPSFAESMREGRLTQNYQNLLRAWAVTHDEVKEAARRDYMLAVHAAKLAWQRAGEGDD